MRAVLKYYKDKYGRVWKHFKDSPWVENDTLGRGAWDRGKGLVEIDNPTTPSE